MKKLVLLGASALALGYITQVGSHAVAQATNSAVPTAALRAIRENVQAVQHNAEIYQWMRVNLEVDRIIAAAHKVEKALVADTSQREQAEALGQAIRDLRSGRLNHNPDRIVAAAQKLATIIDVLDKKTNK